MTTIDIIGSFEGGRNIMILSSGDYTLMETGFING